MRIMLPLLHYTDYRDQQLWVSFEVMLRGLVRDVGHADMPVPAVRFPSKASVVVGADGLIMAHASDYSIVVTKDGISHESKATVISSVYPRSTVTASFRIMNVYVNVSITLDEYCCIDPNKVFVDISRGDEKLFRSSAISRVMGTRHTYMPIDVTAQTGRRLLGQGIPFYYENN